MIQLHLPSGTYPKDKKKMLKNVHGGVNVIILKLLCVYNQMRQTSNSIIPRAIENKVSHCEWKKMYKIKEVK